MPPLLRRRRTLAAKIEVTAGQAESLTATEAAINVFDPIIQPNVEMEQREGQGNFGMLPASPAGRLGTCTFSTELTSGSSAPSWATTFLPACGLIDVGSDGVYLPLSRAPGGSGLPKTLTIGLYEDGVKKALRGCMGNAVFRFVAGMRAMVDFTFTGIWVDPADVAILEPTYPTVPPLRFASSELLIAGAYAPKLRELTIDLGNEVVMREDANDASGYCHAVIANRLITGTMDPELVLVGTKDWHNEWLTSTQQALAFALSASGQYLAFSAPKMQFTNLQEGNRNNLTVENITFQLNPSAANADDALSITFDDAPPGD